MSVERAVYLINLYISFHLNIENFDYRKRAAFRERSFSLWAANQILTRVEALDLPWETELETGIDVFDVIDNYILVMRYYAKINDQRDFIENQFSLAVKTAIKIKRFLIEKSN